MNKLILHILIHIGLTSVHIHMPTHCDESEWLQMDLKRKVNLKWIVIIQVNHLFAQFLRQ